MSVVTVNGHDWTTDELRDWATSLRDQHDPAKQEGNGYDRCEHCHYTRHPCDTFDLASIVLALIDV